MAGMVRDSAHELKVRFGPTQDPEEPHIRAGRLHPKVLGDYVATERRVGHAFRHHLPLADIQAAIAAGEDDGGTIANYCM